MIIDKHRGKPRHIIELHRRNIDMGKKLYPSNVLKDAVNVQIAWKQIDEQLAFGSLNMAGLVTTIESMHRIRHDLARLEKALIDIRNQRDELYLAAWDQVKRVRAGMKSLYGDDSTAYELVGGTRRSERKKPRRAKISE
jgi:hypothetical protein